MSIDDTLAGRYRRVGSLGHGAMGEVWLADDLVLGRRVAIKQLKTQRRSDMDSLSADRMLREARTLARLRHPGVVPVYDLLSDAGRPFLVMEYVEGESLADLIERTGGLSTAEAARVLAQVASALDAAHRAGVVHRDVKPANILIDASGTAKLSDFGIARGSEDAQLTDVGQVLGTITFMAPEVARTGVATAASDVWSLGATLYAATDGHAPFDVGDGLSTPHLVWRLVTEPVPPPRHCGELTPLVLRMTAHEPTDRPSAGEVQRELRDYLARIGAAEAVPPSSAREPGEPAAARPAAATRVASDQPTRLRDSDEFALPFASAATERMSPRRKLFVLLAVVCVAALAIGIVLFVSRGGGSKHRTASAGGGATSSGIGAPLSGPRTLKVTGRDRVGDGPTPSTDIRLVSAQATPGALVITVTLGAPLPGTDKLEILIARDGVPGNPACHTYEERGGAHDVLVRYADAGYTLYREHPDTCEPPQFLRTVSGSRAGAAYQVSLMPVFLLSSQHMRITAAIRSHDGRLLDTGPDRGPAVVLDA